MGHWWLGGRAGKGHKGWGEGATGRQAPPGNQPSPWEFQHQTQRVRFLLILTSPFIKGRGEEGANTITRDRAFGTSLEEASAGG